jgi:hypothetical protein
MDDGSDLQPCDYSNSGENLHFMAAFVCETCKYNAVSHLDCCQFELFTRFVRRLSLP